MSVGAAAERRVLLGLAIFAMAWAIVRARVQAITIDEAVTYVNFVYPDDPTWWSAHANNHVLNSVMMRIFTGVFGTSHLTVRSGALIGAAVFILAAYFLSALIGQSFLLRLSLFICLVFNPLIFDFLVAARGYGLASGFLLCAICLVAYAKRPEATTSSRSLVRACILASVCMALSFASNFSFAFVDAATLALLYIWTSAGSPLKTRGKLAAACFLPCLLLDGALVPLLLKWEEPLTYGAAHLSETFRSLFEASFYELRPSVSDLIFVDVPGVILPMFALFAAWRVGLILINWQSLRNARGRWAFALTAIPITAVSFAVFVHWLLFRLTHTPLPKDRTGIYIVVLITLSVGMLAAVPIPTRAGDLSRRSLTILMVILGSYFMLCLRVSYFKEWKWDSDTDKLYSVLADYHRACGLKDVAVNWRYNGSLNFYRVASTPEAFPSFLHILEYPAGKRAYVLYGPEDRNFIASHALTVAYQAPSGAVIALDPAIEPPPGESACTIPPPHQSK